MQERKQELLNAISKVIKGNRKTSISQICNEIDLSKSIWSELEKGRKDIQLTTFWRIAEAYDIKPSNLLKQIEEVVGEKFSFIEDTSGDN